MVIEISYLRHFVAAVEEGSIGNASRKLNISQPAVTRSIRQLEEHLEAQLLERGSKGVSPTPYGDNLYIRAKSILSDLQRAELEIGELKGGSQNLITIGALPSQANFILPEATIRFAETRPTTRVRVIQKTRAEILPSLMRREFDLIFGILDEPEGGDEVAQRLLFHDRPSIIVRADHPVLTDSTDTARRILEYPWILPRPEADHRLYLNAYCRTAQLPLPNVVVECQTTPYLKAVVMQSDYVGVLPTNLPSVEEQAGYIKAVSLDGLEKTIPFGIQYLDDHPVSAATRQFIAEIEAVCDRQRAVLETRVDLQI